MIISSILTHLDINFSHLERFFKQFLTAIENVRFEIYLRFYFYSNIQNFLFFTDRGYLLNTTLQVFSSKSRSDFWGGYQIVWKGTRGVTKIFDR